MQPGSAAGAAEGPSAAKQARLTKSRTDKKIAGVCGGIGNYVQIDPVIVRLGFVLAGLASAGIMIILYVILAIVLPSEPERIPEPAGAGI
jgi:phage shock protein C